MWGFTPDVEHVSAEEAIALSTGESILLDVRERWEYDLGHAPSARNLPMSELDERLSEINVDATVLVVCHSGQRSLSVTAALGRAGITALNVDGGMLAWQAAGGVVVAEGSEEPRV
jgi:rhodanese-related sulfurtransferase